jgi:hypothetical protein
MHDGKLLSDNEMESTESRGEKASIAVQAKGRTTRANVWTIIGFCIVGLIFSFFTPASYLRGEQTSSVFAEAPLS